MDYPHSYRYVDDAVISRRSIRAYLERPVEQAVVADILDVARRAPSGTNTQPWKVYAVTGEVRARLCARVHAAFDDPQESERHSEEYPYYPAQWIEPYLQRRRTVGFALYGLLGIGKGDKARMHAQHGRNYLFFDAPVGLVFTIDRRLAQGSWLDYGMFVQTVMLVARARGLDTCPQVSLNKYHRIIEEELSLPANEMMVCCVSLGYADPQAPENALVSDREPVEAFAQFHGW